MRFWEDEWNVVGVPLKAKYPRLYLISDQHNQYIQQMGMSSDTRWEWRLQWRRLFFDAEIDMVAKFMQDIEGLTICPYRHDKWVWRGDPTGSYSVGSMYK